MKKRTKVLLGIVVLIFLFIQLYPVLWLFMASLKPTTELSVTPFALPQTPTFANYAAIFKDGSVFRYMLNSLRVTVISILLIVALSSTAGYALAKFHFAISRPIYRFFTSAEFILLAGSSAGRICATPFRHDVLQLLQFCSE